jgi:hypothetical protein
LKKLVPNIVEDQKVIWSFPRKLAERRNLIPTLAFVVVGTALVVVGMNAGCLCSWDIL